MSSSKTVNTSIQFYVNADGLYTAVATFPPGLFAARKPIVGTAQPTPDLALTALLDSPKFMAAMLGAMISPDAPDAD